MQPWWSERASRGYTPKYGPPVTAAGHSDATTTPAAAAATSAEGMGGQDGGVERVPGGTGGVALDWEAAVEERRAKNQRGATTT